MKLTFNIQGGDFTHAGKPSSEVKKVLKQLNVDGKTVKNIVIALYEAEVNVVAHAWKGTVSAEIDENKITIFVEDDGPGIPDIELAMQAGYSTASKKVRGYGVRSRNGFAKYEKEYR